MSYDGFCRGASNTEIGADLRMGERTVKSHVSAILTKLDSRDRAMAIVVAYDAGLEAYPGELSLSKEPGQPNPARSFQNDGGVPAASFGQPRRGCGR
jgi:hypothetical protein